MTTTEELLELERAAWKALSTDGETAAAFYEEVLAPSVLMLLPGGLVIEDREAAIESMSGEPWSSFELDDERVVSLTDQSAVVAYRASAARGDLSYSALISSTYVRGAGKWRLALHQQTPT
ncbi:MAG TPA: nuclear transport factor 2 family protein [Acidimicrobiales bacterium]